MRRFKCGLAAAVVIGVAIPYIALAQPARSYPSKPIRLVIAQPPGGSVDINLRSFAIKMSETLGQPIIIDNRSGGGVASISTLTTVASANPDGHTLLGIVPNFTFLPALINDFPLDLQKAFAPASQLTRQPYLLVVHPSLPVKTVKELIGYSHAKPGVLNLGAGNIGSGTHLVTMSFATSAGIRSETTYIPYKGTGPALIDLMAGRIHVAITSIISSGPPVRSGKLRALGVTSAQRSKVFPELPTIAEQGLPGFEAISFLGLAAPAKTPTAILNQLSAAAAVAAKSPEVGDRLKDDGGEGVGGTPEELRQLIAREIPRWRKLVKELGITATPE